MTVAKFASLAVVVAVAVVLRWIPVHESLWIDELHTSWTVAENFQSVSERAALGNNGPLFFSIVYGVVQLLGHSEWSLRLVSLLASVGVVVATYLVCRIWNCQHVPSLLAASLVAMDHNTFLFFAREARPYALVQLVALLHLYAFWYGLTRGATAAVVTWLVTGAVLFHLHCTTALAVLAEVVAFLVCRWYCREAIVIRPRVAVAAILAFAATTLPASGLLWSVAERRENWELFVKRQDFVATLTMFPLHSYLLVPLVLAVFAWCFSKSGQTYGRDFHVPLVILGCGLCVPLVGAWGLTEFDIARLFFRRYVIASSVTLAPLTAILLSFVPTNRMRLTGCGVVFLAGLFFISPMQYAHLGANALSHSLENWRGAVEHLRGDDRHLPILLRSGLIEADAWFDSEDALQQAYCQLPIRGLYSLKDAGQRVISLPTTYAISISPKQEAEISQQRGAWLLIRGTPATVERVTAEVLDELVNGRVVQTHPFRHVTLVEIAAEHVGPDANLAE